MTDLVFVDPVGTGFSRALGKHENKEFWGLNEDADAVADFIQTWVTRNKRWASPKYLLGESFGTTRAAAVAGRLEGGAAGISLNGLVLVSQALDYTGSTPDTDNLVACVTYLPTMAATAWYHGKIKDRPASLPEFLAEARAFAVDEYAPALFKGSRLNPAARARSAPPRPLHGPLRGLRRAAPTCASRRPLPEGAAACRGQGSGPARRPLPRRGHRPPRRAARRRCRLLRNRRRLRRNLQRLPPRRAGRGVDRPYVVSGGPRAEQTLAVAHPCPTPRPGSRLTSTPRGT